VEVMEVGGREMAGKDLFGNDLPEPEEFEYLKHEDEETQLETMPAPIEPEILCSAFQLN